MMMFRNPTSKLESEKANLEKRRDSEEVKNIVIFGETGVGKSSLINLIADKIISETSSRASGCTLSYARHLLTINGQQSAVWDTAGLGEGTHGTVPAEKAEAYLKQLLLDLSKASGIDLLIYCVRGTRIRTALLTNYHLFYSAICRKKVPICLVVTGLENQDGNMETWWLKNERQFSALQMHFDNYACVTTLESSMVNPILQERRRISRIALVNMITETCRSKQWTPAGRSWIDTAFSDIHAMLSPARDGHAARVAHVILCHASRQTLAPHRAIKRSVTLQSPVCISSSRTLTRRMTLRNPVSVLSPDLQSKLPFNVGMRCTPERLFRIYQVPQKQTQFKGEDETKKDMIVKRGADLLIFCVQKQAEENNREVKSQWEHFNLTYGGDLSPQIVVILGAKDQNSAEEWWNSIVGVAKPGDASVAYLPEITSVAETEAASQLRTLINTRCIDCSKANFARRQHIFRRATLPLTSEKRFPFSWISPSLKKRNSVPLQAHQEVLTDSGVWEQISPA